MPQEYQPAPEVKEVARRLIDDFHTHLATVRIEYVFCVEQLKEKGKVVWGRAKKVSGLNAWLADEDRDYGAKSPDDFFVVEIHRATWLMIDEKSRRALVDHELCHFWVDENGNLAILGHDLEEFNAVVRRHGLWADDIKFFLEAAGRQKELFDIAGQVMDRVADEINAGALGPDVTASVQKGARA
ncbi:MAG TPA: putative metallopeptidase [Blastocatellia bacterium]|nr:putative metallopeptidase [Blastocatellia bacterium]